MRTFAQYLEDVAVDFGRSVLGRGLSKSHAEVLSTLSQGVDAAVKNPSFAGKLARMLVTAAEADNEVRMALGSDFEPSAFVSDVVRAAKSNADSIRRNSPPSGETVSPQAADAPIAPE